MSEELLNCPFCGKEAEMVEQQEFGYYAKCIDNDCGIGPDRHAKEEAIEAWNKRA